MRKRKCVTHRGLPRLGCLHSQQLLSSVFFGYMSDNVDLRWLSCVGFDERKAFPKRAVEDLTALICSMMFCSGRNSKWISTIRINFD